MVRQDSLKFNQHELEVQKANEKVRTTSERVCFRQVPLLTGRLIFLHLLVAGKGLKALVMHTHHVLSESSKSVRITQNKMSSCNTQVNL